MLGYDGDSNLESAQVLDICKIGTTIFDKSFGFLESVTSFGEQVIQRLVLTKARFGLVFEIVYMWIGLLALREGSRVGNCHVGGREGIGWAHD